MYPDLSISNQQVHVSPAWMLVLLAMVGVAMGGYPMVTPSVGQVWPRPQMIKTEDTYMVIRHDTFK